MWPKFPSSEFAASLLIFKGLAGFALADEGARANAVNRCLAELSAPVHAVAQRPDGGFATQSGRVFKLADVLGDDGDPGFKNYLARRKLNAVPLGPEDRWEETPSLILANEEKPWEIMQLSLLRDGRTLFAPRHVTGDCADIFRQSEAEARRENRGLWSDGRENIIYSSSAADRLKQREGAYAIVQGKVVSLGKTSRTRYLNFGSYWKEDFTATVPAKHLSAFENMLEADGWTFEGLAGQRVEIRGYVQIWDGPHIELRYPEQLSVLDHKE